MTPFKTVAVIKHPVSRTWIAMRDQLSQFAPMLDDIDTITVREREDGADGTVRLVNEWRVRPHLPAALLSLIDPDSLGWLDRAAWREADHCCEWRIEPFFLPGRIHCAGTTTYEPAIGGRGTRVTFEGGVEIDARWLTARVAVLDKPLSSVIESVLTALVPKNFRKIVDVAASMLDGGGPGLSR